MAFKKKRANINQHQSAEFVEKWKAAEKARLAREAKQIDEDMIALKEKIDAATAQLEQDVPVAEKAEKVEEAEKAEEKEA